MSQTLSRITVTAGVLAGLAAGGFGLAATAAAKGGGAVRTTVACSTGTLSLKAKHDDGRIEVEAELDTNRVGQKWAWALTDNRVAAGSGTATTVAPSGSFGVKRYLVDRAGTDTIGVRVTRGTTACTARVAV